MTRVYESEGISIWKEDAKYLIMENEVAIDSCDSFEEAYPLAQYYIKEKKRG